MIWLWWFACSDAGIEPWTPPDPTFTTPPDEDPCAVPLAVAPEHPAVAALGGTRFVATGGSGPYVYTLVEDASGGTISRVAGFYVAGPRSGVEDVVEVTDEGCGGSARGAVVVTPTFTVAPTAGDVLPGTVLAFEVSGGTGAYRCEADRILSGGALQGCVYTAGDIPGRDELTVVDDATGAEVGVALTVDPDATLAFPADHLLVPLGSPVYPAIGGGTGHRTVEVVAGDGAVDVAGDAWTGTAEGSVTLRVSDRFTAIEAAVTVHVAEARGARVARDGERSNWAHVLALGDVTGDGYDDVAVAVSEASVTAHESGAVYVYAGGPGGPAVAPIQTLSWPVELAQAGRGVAAGDFDGDGALELAVGAEGAGNGLVLIYEQDGAGFAPEPAQILTGARAGDRFGFSLGVCDLDLDGLDDLLVGALAAEDLTRVPVSNSAGGLYVYRGAPFGFGAASWSAYGRNPSGDTFVDVANLQIGRQIATGDWTGDGRCDVAVSSFATNLGTGAVGGVYLYDGAELTSGVAPVSPARVFSPDPLRDLDKSAQFGASLDLADVDGDGRADLAIGAPLWDASALSSGGAAFVYLAADDVGTALRTDLDASWTLAPDEAGDNAGASVAWTDQTGDGVPDLLVGSLFGDVTSPSGLGAGSVAAYDGAGVLAGGTVQQTAALWILQGAAFADTFGVAADDAGDLDGDGLGDLVVHAGRKPTFGPEVGQPQWIPGDAALPVLGLEMPGVPAGSHFGDPDTFALADVTGDGEPDLVLGGPGVGDPLLAGNSAFNAGQLFTLPWDGARFASVDAAAPWTGVPTRSANDLDGFAFAPVGDFDGDGYGDVARVSWNDAVPINFPSATYQATTCLGNVGGAGSLWIHRGGASGVEPSPSVVMYGLGAGDHVEKVVGGFDYDGDGLGDVLYGSVGYSNTGGVSISRGRPYTPPGIQVSCDEIDVLGTTAGSNLGSGLCALGDLDGDGCDEVAVGADADDLGFNNQGSVRVLWGTGPGCAAPRVTTLAPMVSNARAGRGLACGRDVDADGLPDLVVGAYDSSAVSLSGGAAWVVSGAALASLPTNSWDGLVLPDDTSTVVTDLDLVGTLFGSAEAGADYGFAVALVPNPADPGRAYVAIGSPFGALGGAPRSGGVEVWRWGDGAFEARPRAVVLGEGLPAAGEMGGALWAGVGPSGGAWLLVGANLSDAVAVDGGAVYPFPVALE